MNKRSSFPSIIFLLLLVLLFFAPLVSGRFIFFFHDLKAFYLPCKHIYSQELSRGNLLFWTHLGGGGFPLHAEGQTGVFYPFNLLLYGLLSVPTAYVLSVLIHYFLSGLGGFFLATEHDVSKSGALLSALSFTFSGFLISHLFHMSIMTASAWLPWIFLFFSRGLKRQDWKQFLLLGLVGAMQILAGHQQVTFISFIGLIIYGGVEFVLHVRGKKCLRGLFLCLLALCLGLLIGAVQIIPSLELIPETGRGDKLMMSYFLSGSFPPQNIITLFFPNFFGINSLPVRGLCRLITGAEAPNPWIVGGLPLREAHIYMGILPLMLVLILISDHRRMKKFPFALLMTLFFSFMLMLGKYSPLSFVWHVLTPFNFFRFPVRFALLFSLTFSILGGIGWDVLWLQSRKAQQRMVSIFIAGLILMLVFLIVAQKLVPLFIPSLSSQLKVHFSEVESVPDSISDEEPRGYIKAHHPRSEKIIRGLVAALDVGSVLILPPLIIYMSLVLAFGARLIFPGRDSWFRVIFLTIMVLDLFIFGVPYNPYITRSEMKSLPQTAAYLEEQMEPFARVAVVSKTRPDYYAEMEALYGDGLYNSLLHPSYNFFWNISNIGTPSPLILSRWQKVLDTVGLSFSPQPHQERQKRISTFQSFLRSARISHLISAESLEVAGWTEQFKGQGARIYQDMSPFPKVLCFTAVKYLQHETEMFETVLSPLFNPETEILIERAAETTIEPTNSVVLPPGTIREKIFIEQYTSHRMGLIVESPRPCFLLITDTYYPGWDAFLNGENATIDRANLLFRALKVGEGTTNIQLVYKPFSIKLGLFISLLAVLVLLLLFFQI
ncbi:hypothetical protein ACFL27_16765 [candidate division CSSED10-310 bacterium]|uniref:YfhO family protein n=1 Tax=candidate division CSSED10-310 bacterium TaxID=2855610 RepID=A0ABV6Z073_UNCC1